MFTVLVIEDESLLLEEVLEWLQYEGYNAIGAPNGIIGTEMALKQHPDVILSDIMMPHKDGYRVLLDIRTNPDTALTPFIFMSAKADRFDIRSGMELGADDYITKPFSREELLGTIRTRLNKQTLIEDKTEKALEELRRSIAYLLPHELRTPLVSIIGYGELLSLDASILSASKIQEMGLSIVESGNRLHHLIENYLLYAQIELLRSDRRQLEHLREERLDNPQQVIKYVTLYMAERAKRVSDIRFDLAPDTRIHVSHDSLKKILEEVLGNAFKFSKPGSPVELISVATGDVFTLQITDHGRGMTTDQVRKLGAYLQFDRRFHEQQGSGLGLTIANSLIDLHGGRMEIMSEHKVALRSPSPFSKTFLLISQAIFS
jgi:two-component system, sensor histidine kinase and response regulator